MLVSNFDIRISNLNLKIMKKIALILISSFLIFISTAPFFAVKAATSATVTSPTWYSQDFQSWIQKVDDQSNPSEIFGERYTSAQVEWVIYGVFAFFINHVAPPGTAGPCIGGDATACITGITSFFSTLNTKKSADLNNNQSLTSLIFADRPLSGVTYFRGIAKNFTLVPIAHAQSVTGGGFGFGAFNPILDLWRATRNFAFFLAVIGVIVVSFMIMFRVKISPQIVISVQSALPKIVLALIFITFSYAIAGLMVDLMYVVIGAIALFLGPQLAPSTGGAVAVYKLMTDGLPVVGGGFLPLMALYFVTFLLALMASLFAGTTMGLVTAFLPALAGVVAIIYIIMVVVVVVVLVFLTFKIVWLLIKTTAQILLLVIFGPILIALSLIMPTVPSLGMGGWLRSLLSNLAVYPVVGTLFVISWMFNQFAFAQGILKDLSTNFFLQAIGISIKAPSGGWSPPLTFAGDQIGLIFVGVSFAIIAIIPKTAELIQSLLAGKPFGYGEAIGEAVGPVNFGVGYAGTSMARTGQLPWPLSSIYSRLGLPVPNPTHIQAIGETIQNAQKVGSGR